MAKGSFSDIPSRPKRSKHFSSRHCERPNKIQHAHPQSLALANPIDLVPSVERRIDIVRPWRSGRGCQIAGDVLIPAPNVCGHRVNPHRGQARVRIK